MRKSYRKATDITVGENPIPRFYLETLTERLQSHKPQEVVASEARRAAVSLILTPVAGDFEVLFMKRVERRDDPWSGQISLPGGHQDPDDYDLAQTARRETLEEVGLEITTPPIGQLDDVYPRTPLLPPVVVRPFVFVVEPFQHLSLGNEATLEIRVLLGDLSHNRQMRAVAEHNLILSMQGYAIGPHFVWGLTERVLTSFLTIAGSI